MLSHQESIEAVGLRVKRPEEIRNILGELRRRLEALYRDRLRGMYLYGSYARGTAEAGSDMDVLVVLNGMVSTWDEIKRTSYDSAQLSLDHDVTISLIFMTEERWLNDATPFVSTVRREGKAA